MSATWTVTLSAVLSLITAVIVAVMGHLLSARRDRRNQLAELRLNSYSDFIQAAVRLAAARRLGKTRDEHEELGTLNAAKTRICVCGDAPVVEALTKFWQAGGTLEQESEILAFTRLCTRMRESLGNARHDLGMIEMSDTLFRLEPSSYSYRAERGAETSNGQKG
jgi:hypothetical protein